MTTGAAYTALDSVHLPHHNDVDRLGKSWLGQDA